MKGAVYLLDKPRGATSRMAASRVAKAWGVRKWGHCGTLDPDATGVLPVLLGSGTKLSRYLTGVDKAYAFTLVLGVITETGDLDGRVLERRDPSGVDMERVQEALRCITGTFTQTVPVFSAVRVDGRRAYRSARSGGAPEMPSRTVSAWNWTLEPLEEYRYRLTVDVSPGTYVRALARDVGELLGSGGVATDIRRERSGAFRLEDCGVGPDDPRGLLSPLEAMKGWPVRRLDAEDVQRVLHGLPVTGEEEGTVLLISPEDVLIAVGLGGNGCIRPVRVLEVS